MDWDAAQTALRMWVVNASGIGAGSVAWAGQKMPRMPKPFVTLSIAGISRAGHDWLTVDDTDPDAITHVLRGARSMTLRLTAYSDNVAGASAAAMLLERVLAKAALPSNHEALRAVGVAVAEWAPVQTIDGLINFATFEPRATVDVMCHFAQEVTETANYIGSVEITDSISDPPITSHVPYWSAAAGVSGISGISTAGEVL